MRGVPGWQSVWPRKRQVMPESERKLELPLGRRSGKLGSAVARERARKRRRRERFMVGMRKTMDGGGLECGSGVKWF